MPSSTSDFLQSFIGLINLKQHQDQIDQDKKNAQVAGIATFLNAARQSANPQDHTALVQQFSNLGIADPTSLTSMLANVTPTEEALKAGAIQEGKKVTAGGSTGKGVKYDAQVEEAASQALAGQSVSGVATSQVIAAIMQNPAVSPQLKAETVARLTAGASTGQVAESGAQAGLGQNTLQAILKNQGGLTLTAGQNQQQGQFNSSLALQRYEATNRVRQGDQSLAQEIKHQTETEAQGAIGLALEAQKGGAGAKTHVASLLATKEQIQKTLETAKNPTPGLVSSFIGTLNGINAQLREANVPTEDPIPYDPNILVNPTAWQGFLQRWIRPKTSPVTGSSAPAPAASKGITNLPFNPWLF